MRLTRLALTAMTLITVCALAQPRASKYSYGIVRRGCAPWDGRAINLVITPKPADCETGVPYLLISIYDLPIKRGNKYIAAHGDPETAQASRCDNDKACDTPDSGEVVFDRFEEDAGTSGHYKIHFHRSGDLQGSFKLEWCNDHELCG